MEKLDRPSRDVMALTVLALLAEQPCHPYEMQRLIRVRHKDFAAGKTRALYHAVKRLTQETLIEPAEVSREGRRPERTVYRITSEGREELEGWLIDLLSTPLTEFPIFNVAVSFLGRVAPAEALSALRARALMLGTHLAAFEGAVRVLGDHLPRVVLLENEHALALGRAELAWVRSLIGDIEAGRLTWDTGQGPNAQSQDGEISRQDLDRRDDQ
jgi:DNA-binding PadR family transcriptional regulator